MRFFVGLDDLYSAKHFDCCFISVNRLKTRVSDFEVKDWIMDSGAFSELNIHGHYRSDVYRYARYINRWKSCGTMLAAVSQDYMCEPHIVAKTGLSVKEHQSRTIARYVALLPETDAYIMPALQGYAPQEYIDHIRQYGSCLKQGAWCAVGSICKRNNHPQVIEYILRKIKTERPDLRLHGLGIKLTALRMPAIAGLLHSSDSLAWSFAARYECRDAHDWHEAENYRKRIAPKQETDLILT